jgi:lysophospholipase L1-like esterase
VKRFAQNLLLVLVSVIVALGAIEVGLRVIVGGREQGKELRDELGRSKASMPEPGVKNVSLRGLIQASANDLIVYELKPGLHATFVGVPVAINRAGFRERELARAKPSGTFRIVGLGDSVMFGWGVPAEATYLRVLEDLLQARGDGVRYETLNFGVPGYNAVMEVETFRAVARSYEPDLVVIGYVPNDDQLPTFMKRSSLRFPGNLYTYNLVVHGYRAMRNRSRDLMPARADFLGARMAAWGDVPAQYRGMEGPEAVRRAYEQMAAMSHESGVPVLVMGNHRGHLDPALVSDLEARGNFRFVDVTDIHAAYERKRGRGVPVAEVILSPSDGHPNVLGHRIYAEGLYDAVVTRGIHGSGRAAARGR